MFFLKLLPAALVLLMALSGSSTGSEKSAGGADGDTNAPKPTPTEEVFEEAKLEIWRTSIEDVIHHNLSVVCRTMILAVKTEGETPRTACTQLRDNRLLMRFTCTARDVELMEAAVCSYDSIVLPSSPTTPAQPSVTPLSPSSSSSSSSLDSQMQPPLADDPGDKVDDQFQKESSVASLISRATNRSESQRNSEDAAIVSVSDPESPVISAGTGINSSGADESPHHDAPSSDVSSASQTNTEGSTSSKLTTKRLAVSSGEASGSIETNVDPQGDESRHQRGEGLLIQDSRLSDACNQILPHLAKALDNKTDSGCEELREMIDTQVKADDDKTGRDGRSAGKDTFLALCSSEDRALLHETFCAAGNDDQQVLQPAHALQGTQQKHVRYVIETALTSTCREALWPLGSGAVREEARDSCRTLAGPEGDRLVDSRVCTRNDVDSLVTVVCDAASGMESHVVRTIIMAALGVLTLAAQLH